MATVTIKIEQFKPERVVIEETHWNDMGRTYEQIAEEVERYIKEQMNIYRHNFPAMTELRWEFDDVGQGHYIQISGEPMTVFVSRLTVNQLLEVIQRAMEIKDWRMVEDCAYQLRLMDEFVIESFQTFEIPYANYSFEWMLTAEDELKMREFYGNDMGEEADSEDYWQEREELAEIISKVNKEETDNEQ